MAARHPNRAPKIADKTVLKSLGQCSFAQGGEIASVDVKNGKIVRIRPHHHEERYTKEELGQYRLEKDGIVYETPLKGLLAPFHLAYKKRVYSPNRIKYPLKRVDWDPRRADRPEAATPEPGHEQVRAHQLGRGGHHHRRRDQARQQGIRTPGDMRPRRRPRRDQDGPRRPRRDDGPPGTHRRLHPGGAQRRQLGGLVLGHEARLGQRRERPVLAGRQHHERCDPAHGHADPHRVRPRDHSMGLRRDSSPPTSSTTGPSWARSRSSSRPTSTTRAPSTPTNGSRSSPTPTRRCTLPSPTRG